MGPWFGAHERGGPRRTGRRRTAPRPHRNRTRLFAARLGANPRRPDHLARVAGFHHAAPARRKVGNDHEGLRVDASALVPQLSRPAATAATAASSRPTFRVPAPHGGGPRPRRCRGLVCPTASSTLLIRRGSCCRDRARGTRRAARSCPSAPTAPNRRGRSHRAGPSARPREHRRESPRTRRTRPAPWSGCLPSKSPTYAVWNGTGVRSPSPRPPPRRWVRPVGSHARPDKVARARRQVSALAPPPTRAPASPRRVRSLVSSREFSGDAAAVPASRVRRLSRGNRRSHPRPSVQLENRPKIDRLSRVSHARGCFYW